MKLWPGGLKRQILTLTLSIVMGASIIIGVIALFVFYQYSQNQVLVRNREIAQVISNAVDESVSHALKITQAIATDPAISRIDRVTVQTELKRLFNTAGVFDGMSLIDSKGTIVAFMPDKPGVIGMDLSERDYVIYVLKNGRQIISEPFLAKTGNSIVVTAYPVKDNNGKVIGLVAGSINLKTGTKIYNTINNAAGLPGMVVQLVSKQGKIIYHPNKDMVMKNAVQNPVLDELLKGKTGSRAVNTNGEPCLMGYAPVKTLGWGVLVEYPTRLALQSAFYLRDLMIIVTAFICLVVFFITFLESRAITKPLEKLLEGVQRVGEGDYHFNVNLETRNEIGVLAASFNSMVDRIKEMREKILLNKEELKRANSELQVMAVTDGLTKLYNHRHFQDCLEKALTLAQQENKPVTLVILDIDHFKYYNDLFGHQAGDKLLEELAQLLIREVGSNETVARYGGEEFTIILYDSDSRNGVRVAERIRAAVESFPFPGHDQQPEGKVTVSIGVASYPENANNKEELIRFADEALFKAKCCSRNKVELYFSVLDELKQDLDRSEMELINSIKMLVRIINAKDKYTYGHSERVGRYAVWIAEEMGLPEDEIKIIKIGAFLHDVGKIEISRSILMKKEPLSKEEYEIIKKHPFWGAGIIKAVESLNPTLALIKFHHEHFDGTGYPLGLKGKQIPLSARILAVADSFDAMSSNRPYRSRKSESDSIEELKRCSGTQFDPEVVEVFLSVLEIHREKAG